MDEVRQEPGRVPSAADGIIVARIRRAQVRRSVRWTGLAALLLVPAVGRDPLRPSDRALVLVLTLLVAWYATQAWARWLTARRRAPQGVTRPRRWRVLVLLPAWGAPGCAAMAVRSTGVGWATAALACALGTAALVWLLPRSVGGAPPAEPVPQPSGAGREAGAAAQDPFSGTAIACSGGGIRAAAFCLGGLQRLRSPRGPGARLYQQADRVYAVSGGSYIATALHLARCKSEPQAAVQDDLFAPGSPEEDWLRRRSKYLLPTGSTLVAGVLSLLYGIAVNLTLVGVTLYLVAAYVGWVHVDLSVICPPPLTGTCLTDGSQVALAFPSGRWLLLGCGVLGAGLLWFVASKTIAKYSGRSRLRGAGLTHSLVTGGIGVAALLVLLPWLLVTTNNATLSNQPTLTAARAMSALGLATPLGCQRAVAQQFDVRARLTWERASARERAGSLPFTYGACGRTWTDDAVVFATDQRLSPRATSPWCDRGGIAQPSFCDAAGGGGLTKSDAVASWAAAIAALAAAVRAMLGGSEAAGRTGSRRGRLADTARRVLLPWAAAAALVLASLVILLRLLRENLLSPGVLTRPDEQLVVVVSVLALKVLSDATLSSLHPFYRERLSGTFLVRREGDTAKLLPYSEPTHVFDSPARQQPDGTQAGPDLVVCCAANIQDRDYVPAARGCAPFQFRTDEGGRIGISDARLPSGRLQRAEPYSASSDPQGYDTTLAAAMAASGAAFSPRLGRMNKRIRPYRMLLALANARLGVWLPNPYLVADDAARVAAEPTTWRARLRWAWRRLSRPGPTRIVKEAIGRLTIDDPRIYVTDGGHYDNTAIVEALRDKPATLIALDASADAADSLDALGDAIVTARMDLGLEIRPVPGCPPELIRRDATVPTKVLGRHGGPAVDEPALAHQGWLHLQAFRIAEPTVPVCDLWFVKNVRTTTPQLELDTYAAEHPAFPITSTDNQFYGEYDFEAYRLLGYLNTDAMLAARELALVPAGGTTTIDLSDQAGTPATDLTEHAAAEREGAGSGGGDDGGGGRPG